MRARIRLLAALCAGALVLALALQAGAAPGEDWDANVIFLALNDSPVPLSDSTMPINVGGTIYVPYFHFDANQNGGIQFGIYNGGQDRVRNTLTLYNSEPRNLTFDLRTGISYDYYLDGVQQDPTAIIRGGQIYVSASSPCRYFGLRYTYSNIAFGDRSYPFVRIWNSNAALSDAQFISAANTSYLIQLQNYYRTVMGQGSENTSPSPEATPSTSPGAENDRRGVRVYLAIRCDTGEAGDQMLDTLRVNGYGALLLFPAEGLAGQDDLIRRAVGEGHMIGLTTSAGDLDSARAQLEEAQDLLSHIARTSTRVVLAENGTVADSLAAEGWLCWEDNIPALPNGRSSSAVYASLARSLEARESWAKITLDDSETSYEVLTRLVRPLQEERYNVRLAVESTF